MTERTHTYADFGIDLRSTGGQNERAVCPKCSPTRKPEHRSEKDLSVDTVEGHWHCQHCGKGGSLRRGWFDDPPPVGGTAPAPPIPERPAPAKQPRLTPIPAATKEAAAYIEQWALDERGITADVVRRYRLYGTRRNFPNLGKAPEGERPAVAIPYFVDGRHVHTKYRTLKPEPDGKKHFTTDYQTPRPWYGIDDVRGAGQAVVVEGEFDKLALATAGVTACVSVPDGAPSAEAERYESKFAFMDDPAAQAAFAKCKKIVLAVDADPAGRKLQDELARRFGFERTWILEWPEGIKDANDFLRERGAEALRAYLNDAPVRYPVDGLFRVSDRRLAIRDRYKYGRPPALSTGWPKMDPVYRVAPGLVTFVVGVPGAGKSHWLNALVTNLMAFYGWRIAVCSPEWQPIEDHMIAMQSLLVGKPFDAEDAAAAGVARMSEKEAGYAQDWLDERAAWILPETVTIPGILERVKVAIATQGTRGVIIDPWSEIETSGERPRGMTTSEWIGESIRGLRKFARAYQVHVWLVIHPTKLELDAEGEWPIPDIYDAAGSANWANMADHTIVVWRSNKTEARATGEVQIISRKTRFKHTGRAGEGVTLWFDPATGRYSDAPGAAPAGWLAAPWEELPAEEERTHVDG